MKPWELSEDQLAAARDFATFYTPLPLGLITHLNRVAAADLDAHARGFTGFAGTEIANHFPTWKRENALRQLGQIRLPDPWSESALIVSPIRPRSKLNDR